MHVQYTFKCRTALMLRLISYNHVVMMMEEMKMPSLLLKNILTLLVMLFFVSLGTSDAR